MLKNLLDRRPQLWILLQTVIYEVLEVGGPLCCVDRGRFLIYDSLDDRTAVLNIDEGWFSSCQLECKAAEGPHVNSFRVVNLLHDLR